MSGETNEAQEQGLSFCAKFHRIVVSIPGSVIAEHKFHVSKHLSVRPGIG